MEQALGVKQCQRQDNNDITVPLMVPTLDLPNFKSMFKFLVCDLVLLCMEGLVSSGISDVPAMGHGRLGDDSLKL